MTADNYQLRQDMICLPRTDFESLLEQAACRGARKALKEVGLADEEAAKDIRTLRELAGSVKIMQRTFVVESKALYAHASRPNKVKWVNGLQASVRPVITYSFFVLFASVKTAALFKLLDQGVGITDGLIAVWDSETQALFAAVMSFWFGQRALSKFRPHLWKHMLICLINARNEALLCI